MAAKMNFEKLFKNIKIKNPDDCKEFQIKVLANKVYLDNQKSNGNIFEDMVLSSSAWTILQEKGSSYINLVPSIDDRRFIEIFFNHEDYDIRKNALKRIENEYILSYIAVNDENEEFRWHAYYKVWDEDFLEHIALNSCDWNLRLNIARYYLKDGEILCQIANECPDFELCTLARNLAEKLGPISYMSYV